MHVYISFSIINHVALSGQVNPIQILNYNGRIIRPYIL